MNLKKLVSPVSLFAIFSVLAFNAFSEEWAQYRSPNHDGKSSEKIPLWPKDSLAGQNDIVFCYPGFAVCSTAVRVTKGNDVLKVQKLWKVTSDKLANHWNTPVAKDGFLYGLFQFKQFGDDPVKCIDLKTGKEKWSQPGFGPGNVAQRKT